MKFFQKQKAVKDERIDHAVNKLYKEAYYIALGIAVLSIWIKMYGYEMQIKDVLSELLIIGIPLLYYWVRMVRMGIYSDSVEVHDRVSKKKMSVKYMIIGLVSGLVISIFMGVRSAMLYGDGGNQLWYFILVFFACMMIYIPFFVSILMVGDLVSRKASKKALPEDEE